MNPRVPEPHRQVITKVNALVDEGIAPLVEALSQLVGVLTLDSCEGSSDRPAQVYFTYGADWHQLGELVQRLARSLREGDFCCDYSLSLEWFGSNDRPRALLTVPKERVAEVATALRQLPTVAVCLPVARDTQHLTVR